MLENSRDEINYHKFLKSVRKSQNVSLEKTAFGICTKSEMSRVEAGTRLPSKLVRDRLTARLGISGEEYEEYLLPREYEQWLLRMDIIRCINKKDVESAEEKLKRYDKKYNKNCVEKQFVEAMKFMIFEMKGFSDDLLCTQAYTAMICTIPDMDAAFKGSQLLADQELNLIMEYVRLYAPKVPEKDAVSWKLKQYDKIANYVEHSRMDKIARAKVYSKLACFVSELVLTKYVKEESLRYALELCTRAIEVLRDTFRLYYFVELNEYRVKLIEVLEKYIEDVSEKDSLAELAQTSKDWANLLTELYEENELFVYMENFTYFYTETECNNASEVIRIRRQMMGLPRIKFCSSACDERTLMRIEHGEPNPTMPIIRDLFEKIGLCAEYKRARLISSNVEVMHMSNMLFKLVDDYEHETAMEYIEKLHKCIDMDIPFNEQELKRQEVIISRRNKMLDNEMQIELLTDILECTLSLDYLMSNGEKYFTITECECIHDFVAYTKGEQQERCRKIIEEMFLDTLEIDFNFSYSCIYELMLSRMASIYGNEGNSQKSNLISDKLLKESLHNRRMYSLTGCKYNNIWNYQHELNKDNNYIMKLLNKTFMLSDIAKLYNWKNFLQQKIDNYSSF